MFANPHFNILSVLGGIKLLQAWLCSLLMIDSTSSSFISLGHGDCIMWEVRHSPYQYFELSQCTILSQAWLNWNLTQRTLNSASSSFLVIILVFIHVWYSKGTPINDVLWCNNRFMAHFACHITLSYHCQNYCYVHQGFMQDFLSVWGGGLWYLRLLLMASEWCYIGWSKPLLTPP